MKKSPWLFIWFPSATLLGSAPPSVDHSYAPYSEGPVWEVQIIKAKYGLEDDYFKNLRTTLKNPLDEAKKQKVILDYKIFFGEAASPNASIRRSLLI